MFQQLAVTLLGHV